jgi:hypothetical protein
VPGGVRPAPGGNVASHLPGDTYAETSASRPVDQVNSDLILRPIYLLSYGMAGGSIGSW